MKKAAEAKIVDIDKYENIAPLLREGAEEIVKKTEDRSEEDKEFLSNAAEKMLEEMKTRSAEEITKELFDFEYINKSPDLVDMDELDKYGLLLVSFPNSKVNPKIVQEHILLREDCKEIASIENISRDTFIEKLNEAYNKFDLDDKEENFIHKYQDLVSEYHITIKNGERY